MTKHHKQNSKMNDQTSISFWSGNRSLARQSYERDIFTEVLNATQKKWGEIEFNERTEDFPGEEESKAFTSKNIDILISVAGNPKFKTSEAIILNIPIAKNLLGYRILIINKENQSTFNAIQQAKDLQKLVHGIPETWNDATIFKANNYQLAEEGNFNDILERLANKRFDYCSFGANEVLEIFHNRIAHFPELAMEQKLLLFYPFPLVFYVHPKQTTLAERIKEGLQTIIIEGKLDTIFKTYYKDIVNQLQLDKRMLIQLNNPLIPANFNLIQADINSF